MKITDNNKLIAEFMGWVYFEKSKIGIDGYPFGGHAGFDEIDVWVLNPTEKYIQNPCHYHYEYLEGIYNDNIEKYDLFEDYTYTFKYDVSWDWLMEVIAKIDLISLNAKVIWNLENLSQDIFNSLREVNIDLTYSKVVNFIKKYNEKI